MCSLFQGLALWEVEAELIERGLVQLCRGQSSGSVALAAGPGGQPFLILPHPTSFHSLRWPRQKTSPNRKNGHISLSA